MLKYKKIVIKNDKQITNWIKSFENSFLKESNISES